MRIGSVTASSPSLLMAGGQPVSEKVAMEAAGWMTVLMEGTPDADQLTLWKQWRSAAPDHERAWRHMEAVSQRLHGLDDVARRTLADPGLNSKPRRRAVQAFAWFATAGIAALMGSRTTLWQSTVADYRTDTGERREVTLADGTRLLLNTASSINIRFTSAQREVELVAGEIMVTTGHVTPDGRPDTRPFFVRSAEGTSLALGTQFTVRQMDDVTYIVVQQSAVRVATRNGSASLVLQAGQQTTFTRSGIGEPSPTTEQSDAWANGQLIADDMRLADFLAELSRYRSGFVRCDPTVADLRFSAVFPLRDTDNILDMLTNSLPVRIHWRNKYWVSVEPWS